MSVDIERFEAYVKYCEDMSSEYDEGARQLRETKADSIAASLLDGASLARSQVAVEVKAMLDASN